MNREELLKIAKPILFNTEMVKAILDGRKTVTRRVVKPQIASKMFTGVCTESTMRNDKIVGCWMFGNDYGEVKEYRKPSYKIGDILYVRETGMIQSMKNFGKKVKILFKADNSLVEFDVSDKEYERLSKWELFKKWLSPYWLTKETARILLKVTDVMVERLQDITVEQTLKEGLRSKNPLVGEFITKIQLIYKFMQLWHSTIKKQDFDKYNWNANPWVWVIELKRLEVEN